MYSGDSAAGMCLCVRVCTIQVEVCVDLFEDLRGYQHMREDKLKCVQAYAYAALREFEGLQGCV